MWFYIYWLYLQALVCADARRAALPACPLRAYRGPRDTRGVIGGPGPEQPSGIFLSCHPRHPERGTARPAQPRPRTISGMREPALMGQR